MGEEPEPAKLALREPHGWQQGGAEGAFEHPLSREQFREVGDAIRIAREKRRQEVGFEEELLKARSAPDQLGLFTGPAEPEPEPQTVRARSHTTLMPRPDAVLPEGMAPGTMRAPSPSSLLAKQNSKASSDGTEGGE